MPTRPEVAPELATPLVVASSHYQETAADIPAGGFLYLTVNRLWYNRVNMENIIKSIASIIATVFIYIFGGWDIALQSLVVVIVLDYMTGLSKAFVRKQISSSIGLKGIVKKVAILALVAVATIVDRLAGETGMIRTLVIYYLVANEGISIIENVAAMGLWVPKILKDRLKQLRGDNDDEGSAE